MKETAALITALAALVAALAWPATVLCILLLFRGKVAVAFDRLPSVLDRMNKIKLGAVEAELERQAQSVPEDPRAAEQISPQQIQAAAKVETQARSLDEQSLRDKIQQLCFEYETIRKVLPSSPGRTRAMTQTVVKMRTLGPAVADWIDELKQSAVAGNRLMAIAIMQIMPDRTDVDWLVERFRGEKPFVFFQAASALKIASQSANPVLAAKAREGAATARAIMNEFQGPKDANTMRVLNSIPA